VLHEAVHFFFCSCFEEEERRRTYRQREIERAIEKIFPETSEEFQDVALCRHYFFDLPPGLLFVYTALGFF
jgi:hypothetical protein